MKPIIYLLFAAIFFIASCKKIDEDRLIGKWRYHEVSNSNLAGALGNIEVTEDSIFIYFWEFNEAEKYGRFTYKITDNKEISLIDQNGDVSYYFVNEKLTNKVWKFTPVGAFATFEYRREK